MTRLRDLEWLVRVAELGHVTEAAARLRTSQPTLSRTVARVEEELGTPVFVRAADGVHLTAAGELVVEAAREVGARWERLRTELDALLDPDAGTVRLSFLDSIASSLVPVVLRDFHAHAPATRVLLGQEPAHEILADLASGATDLAITSFEIGPELAWHPLQEDRVVVLVPPGHRFADRKRLRLAELDGEELVTTPVGFGFRTLVEALLREAGATPVVTFESQDLATIEGLVAAGLGVALAPEPFAGLSGTVGVPVVGAAARRTIGLAWWRDRPLSPPAARFRDFVVASRPRVE
jgi:LysR family transcriptional regulator, transcription activator of glutamate synthase operon